MAIPTHRTRKLRSLLKARAAMIVGLAALIFSSILLTHQTIRVAVAMDVWARRRAGDFSSGEVEEALKNLDNEEIMLIPPFGLTLVSFVIAFHSVQLKIIPRKCFYCRKWTHARKVRQTPDKVFYYHEECQIKGKKKVGV